MLVLLPPSEGKSAPRRGARLDLDRLTFPELTTARSRVLERLVDLCRWDPAAGTTLGLGPSQRPEIDRNAALLEAPTARADRVYTGVLYAALGLDTLDPAGRRRAGRWLATTSSLFGLVRPADRIPAYRLSGDVSLPGLGTIASHWRAVLGASVERAAGDGPVLDLRSGTYQAFWKPSGGLARRTLTARVLHESRGTRIVASHHNKATKGRLVRSLLAGDAAPRSVTSLVAMLRGLGWEVSREGSHLDVVVSEL